MYLNYNSYILNYFTCKYINRISMNRHLKVFEELYKDTKNKFPDFKAGDTIEVKTKIKEGEKTRIQTFKGIVIHIFFQLKF